MKNRNGIIVALILVMAAFVSVFFGCSNDWSNNIKRDLEAFENDYSYRFNSAFPNSDNYDFHSMEAYYIEDENLPGTVHYFIHAKYTAYIDLLEKWSEIEEVSYGDNGRIENTYCLSWDSISGFEDANELFNRAVREGVKKTYTLQEIQELIEKNRPK